MANQVQYGIQINVSGTQQGVAGIDQLTAATERHGETATRVSTTIQGAQTSQASATAQLRTAHTSLNSTLQQYAEELVQAASAHGGMRSASSEAAEQVQRMGASTTQAVTAMQAMPTQATEVSRSLQGVQAAAAGAAQQNDQLRNSVQSSGAAVSGMRGVFQSLFTPLINFQGAAGGASQQMQNTAISAGQMNAALRQVPAQFTDIITSLQGGMNPMTVFMQQGGQLRDMFGGAGAAARALGGYIVSLVSVFTLAAAGAAVLSFAYNEGAKEADAYTKSIIMSGNAAGVYAGQLSDMARNIGQAVGTQGHAAEVVAEMAGTGKIASDNMQRFGQIAIEAERAIGRSASDTVKDLVELGKSPVQASLKLTDQYHYLTAATYEHIKSLEDQGRMAEAASVAQNAYATAMEERSKKLVDNLGTIERAWISVKDFAKSAWDSMLDIGREDTLDQKIAKAEKTLERAKAARWTYIGGGADGKAALDQANAELAALKEQKAAAEWNAKAKAESVRLEEAHVLWIKEGTQFLSKQKQMELEIGAVRQKGEAAGVSDDEINKRVAKVKEKYSELNNVILAGMEAQRSLERERSTASQADLESSQKRQLISYTQYLTSRREAQLKDLDADIKVVRKQADLASGKEDLSERTKYLGQLAVLEERRKGIVKGTDNALAEYAFEATKAIREKAKAWEAATVTDRAALSSERTMFGQSAEARAIANEQLKIEAEARQLIASLQVNGRVLGAGELADIKAAAQARKDAVAAIMGERQALTGAEQLRNENKRFAADSLLDEKARASALLQIDSDIWKERIRLAGEGTEGQRRLQTEYTTWYANQLQKPQIEAQRQFWQSVERTAHDTFVSIMDGGKGAAQRLRDTFKNVFFDWLYQLTLKKWIVNLQGSVNLGGIPGIGNATGIGQSGGGIASLLQSGKGIYDAINSGFTSMVGSVGSMLGSIGNFFGSSSLAGFGGGMGSLAGGSSDAAMMAYAQQTGNVSAAASAGSTVGAIGTAAAGIAGGVYGGRLVSGGYSAFGGSGNSAVNAGTAIGAAVGSIIPVLGTAVGALIGGLIGGAANRLFGHKAKEYTDQKIVGNIDANGFTGDTVSQWTQKGGVFRSDKHGVDTTPIDAELSKSFADTYTKLKTVSGDFAKTLGADISSLATRSQAISIALTKDEEANKKAIADFFVGVGDALARELVPNLQSLQLEGESASAALQRLAGDYQAVDLVLSTIGRNSQDAFGAVGLASVAAREQLIKAAGGVDALASGTAYFAQNFLSDQERMAPIIASVAKQMGALGLSGVQNAEQFKHVVLGLDLSTEAGAKQYAEMLRLAPQFKQVTDYTASLGQAAGMTASQLEQTAAALRGQIAELEKSLMSASDARAAETKGMDAATFALYERREALKAEAATQQANADLQRQIDELLKARMSEAEVVAMETASMNESTRTLYDRLQGLKAEDAAMAQSQQAYAAGQAAYEKQLADQKALAERRASMEVTLYNLTHTEVEQLAFARRQELAATDATLRPLQQQIYAMQDQAKAAQSAADQLASAAARAQAIASERASIQRDVLQLQGDTTALRKLELDALDPANRAAKQAYYDLQDKMAADREAAANAQAIAQAMADAQQRAAQEAQRAAEESQRAADAVKAAWQSATDAVMEEAARISGLVNEGSATSVANAQAAFTTATAQARAGDMDAFKALPKLSQRLLELMDATATSAVELNLVRAQTMSSLDLTSQMASAKLGLKLPAFDVGTNVVPYDMVAQIHAGERIIPAADNRELMSRLSAPMSAEFGPSNNLAEEVRLLREQNDKLGTFLGDALFAIANNTLNAADVLQRWESIGPRPARQDEEVSV